MFNFFSSVQCFAVVWGICLPPPPHTHCLFLCVSISASSSASLTVSLSLSSSACLKPTCLDCSSEFAEQMVVSLFFHSLPKHTCHAALCGIMLSQSSHMIWNFCLAGCNSTHSHQCCQLDSAVYSRNMPEKLYCLRTCQKNDVVYSKNMPEKLCCLL